MPDITPNLNLYKVNPETDRNDTFNIDLALNDNWDKIDEAVNAVEDVVADHSTRLDTATFADLTLNPGMQIVNSAKTTRFGLGTIKGRTLINLLGRAGGFENGNDWAVSAQSAEIDKTVHADGSTQSLKITLGGVNGNINRTVNLTIGKTYLLAADVAKITTSKVYVSITSIANGNEITGNSFGLSFARFTATSTAHTIAVVGSGAAGQVFNADNVRLYEVNAGDYAALVNMTPEQVAAKYPYVDSVQPARNPYAIRYGENLLPPFSEWNLTDTILNGPYSATLTPLSTNRVTYFDVPIVGGKTYTLSAQHNGNIALSFFRADGTSVNSSGYTTNQSVRLASNSSDVTARISFSNLSVTAGSFTITNPMLTLGSAAKPFKPREDAMLALQTDLFADPLTGSTTDEVFVRDGQYFKLKKWKRLTFDGSGNWSSVGTAPGFKRLKLPISDAVSSNGTNSWVTKYDGSLVPYGDSNTIPNVHHIITSQGGLFLSIPSADSGWGDSYTPTADEIKSYFMGWVMFNASASVSSGSVGPSNPANNYYNGTGTKGWARRSGSSYADGTSVLPTTQAAEWTPYQLVYQLATPTVEPITSEGALTLVEGDNQVEVGTGLVVRESVKPAFLGGYYEFNNSNSGLASSKFKYLVRKVVSVFSNGKPITNWTRISAGAVDTAYGERFNIAQQNFDPSAAYSVTYFMLDKSPIVPFTGSAAANEKALLQDVTSVNKRISNAEAVAQQAVAAAQQAFTSASDGKVKVRNAITGLKGTVTDADGDGIPTYDELVAGIGTIATGKPYATGKIYFSLYSSMTATIQGLAFSPDLVVVAYRYQSGGNYANLIGVAYKYAAFPSSAGETYTGFGGWFSNNQSNLPSGTGGGYYFPTFREDGVVLTLSTQYFTTTSMPTQQLTYWAFKLT